MQPPSRRGAIVLAQRGNCTFSEKAAIAARAHAAGLIIVNNSTECLDIAASNSTDAPTAHDLEGLFVATADHATGAELYASLQGELVADVVVAYAGLRPRKLDPSCIVLWALAAITIVVASVWSGRTFEARVQRERDQRAASTAAALDERSAAALGGRTEEGDVGARAQQSAVRTARGITIHVLSV